MPTTRANFTNETWAVIMEALNRSAAQRLIEDDVNFNSTSDESNEFDFIGNMAAHDREVVTANIIEALMDEQAISRVNKALTESYSND